MSDQTLKLIPTCLINFNLNRVFQNYYFVVKRCKKYLAFYECRTRVKYTLISNYNYFKVDLVILRHSYPALCDVLVYYIVDTILK